MVSVSEFPLGNRLRTLRESRKLSRSHAERLGGLGLGTVKAWETGSRTPRGLALTRLLDTLDATDRERAELVALADPRHARLALQPFPAGPPIELGVMLRAFRLRKGWTQAHAGRALGVTQGAVAHWETGERQLEGPALHHALFTLGATTEEVAAVLMVPHAASPSEDNPSEVQHEINGIAGVLREPFLLASERDLWWRAVREPRWEMHLRQAMIHRAVWYAFTRRFDEIKPLWNRILKLTPDPAADPLANVVAIVLADIRIRPTTSAERQIKRLDGLVSTLDPSPVRSWAQGTQAVALASLGERRAVSLAEEALEELSATENASDESWHRTVDLAEVHLRLGDPDRALETLGDSCQQRDDHLWKLGFAPAGIAVRARALAALNREPEPELMATLRAHAETDGTSFFQDRLEAIERDLKAMRRRSHFC